MLTVFSALAVLGGCTAARWRLSRRSRRTSSHFGGHVRLESLWNEGAAFGLPIPEGVLALAPAALGMLWARRKRCPIGTGLLIGGGASNLWERLQNGRVYDYLRFPKAPEPLGRYVFNLADLAILGGGLALVIREKKR